MAIQIIDILSEIVHCSEVLIIAFLMEYALIVRGWRNIHKLYISSYIFKSDIQIVINTHKVVFIDYKSEKQKSEKNMSTAFIYTQIYW